MGLPLPPALRHARGPLLLLLTWLCWAVGGAAAEASGARVAVAFASSADGEDVARARVWISQRRLRVEQLTPGERGSARVLIYRGDLDRLYSLDPDERTYIQVNRELIAALSLQTIAARHEIDTKMRQLPKDQYKVLEQLLGLEQSEEPIAHYPLIIEPTEAMGRAAGLECRKVDLVRRGRRVGELCIVPWATVGIGPTDLEVFRQFANFQRELIGARDLTPLEFVPDQPLDILAQFDGFPLYLRRAEPGATSVIRVTEVEPLVGAVDRLFEVPESYAMLSAFEAFFGAMAGSLDGGGKGSRPTPPARPQP